MFVNRGSHGIQVAFRVLVHPTSQLGYLCTSLKEIFPNSNTILDGLPVSAYKFPNLSLVFLALKPVQYVQSNYRRCLLGCVHIRVYFAAPSVPS